MNKSLDVAIIIGSKSDLPIINETIKILDDFHIKYSLNIASAHRTHDYLIKCIRDAETLGVNVFIAAAGMAAALPGFIASMTLLPVIGIPIANVNCAGLDSLLSISQMPKGVPVATVSFDKTGAVNAAIFAVQILSIKCDNNTFCNSKRIREQLKQYKNEMENNIIQDNLNIIKS
ncbi:MAG: 5-(carboxyamino)imidazole ribonucleotide mutase [Endomicrobium sp.]|jgi:5-(carboxyamino)imidazole ribonucleotide mutase|nr:5-(carboxyamino)imidazole ribonucleotide mutase [Endomicrobium sp.]